MHLRYGAFASDFSNSSKVDPGVGHSAGWIEVPSDAYYMDLTYTADATPLIHTKMATAVPSASRALTQFGDWVSDHVDGTKHFLAIDVPADDSTLQDIIDAKTRHTRR